jgi:hypothetical protein
MPTWIGHADKIVIDDRAVIAELKRIAAEQRTTKEALTKSIINKFLNKRGEK